MPRKALILCAEGLLILGLGALTLLALPILLPTCLWNWYRHYPVGDRR